MKFSLYLVWLVSFWFSATTRAAAVLKADVVAVAERKASSENESTSIAGDVRAALAARDPEAAPVTTAATSPDAAHLLFKRDCMIYEFDTVDRGPGPNTFNTLVRLFRERYDKGNFKIAEGQQYCVSCSGAMLKFSWEASYIFTSNTALFEQHMRCIDPWDTRVHVSDGAAWPYGGYTYAYVHHWHEGDVECHRC